MSFPIDESMQRVYDLSGSVSEWLDAWWLEDRGVRFHAGGSWADGGPAMLFGITGGNGDLPEHTGVEVGLRLVLHREPAPQ